MKEASCGSSNFGSDEEALLVDPILIPGQLCVTHKLMVHSFHKLDKKLICTLCVQERGLSGEDLVIFPAAIRDIKSRISDAKDLNKQRKMQLA